MSRWIHRQPIKLCLAHATAQSSLEESQAVDGALTLDARDGLRTSDLGKQVSSHEDALTTNERSISIACSVSDTTDQHTDS